MNPDDTKLNPRDDPHANNAREELALHKDTSSPRYFRSELCRGGFPGDLMQPPEKGMGDATHSYMDSIHIAMSD